MPTILTRAGQWLIPVAVVAARIILNEGLTEMERVLQSVFRKGAEQFLRAHPRS